MPLVSVMGAGPSYLPERRIAQGVRGIPPARQTKRRGGSSPSKRSAALNGQQTLDTYQ
jgi:hypothetical protein